MKANLISDTMYNLHNMATPAVFHQILLGFPSANIQQYCHLLRPILYMGFAGMLREHRHEYHAGWWRP
jgi:hypothetical protein